MSRVSWHSSLEQRDGNVARGEDKYYEIWFGHRLFYVRAADVVVNQ